MTTIRTITNLPVRRHLGAPTGITFILSAPLVAPLHIGEIHVTNAVTATITDGVIDDGTGPDDPGRVDVLAVPLKFAELVVLAALPNTIKLTVTVSYDDDASPKKVTDITCRRVAVAVAAE